MMNSVKRPILITISCVLGFLWMFIAFVKVFSPSVKKLGMFVPSAYGLIVALLFISWVGIWYMKRWGVAMFVIFSILRIAFLFFIEEAGFSNYFGIVLSFLFLVLFAFYYKQMDRNL